ncbi:MAG: C40 family peptidase [Archangiaceae bacterium]|nr:C40 family peptidase [Archangiaceae bacterium]
MSIPDYDPNAAARAAALAEARRKAIEEAARRAEEAAKAAAEAAKQLKKLEKTVPIFHTLFGNTGKPPVQLKPPTEGTDLSAGETQAYTKVAKAITTKDPSADPHAIIAKSPELVDWISRAGATLDVNQDPEFSTALDGDLSTRLSLKDGAAALASPTDASPLGDYDGITDKQGAMAALDEMSPQKADPNAPHKPQTAEEMRAMVAQWAIAQANDPNVGYSQNLRDNGKAGGKRFFDCSSLVSNAWEAAGLKLNGSDYPMATSGMWDTHNNWAQTIEPNLKKMQPDNLILMSGHVVMYTGDGKCVGARTNNMSGNPGPANLNDPNFADEVTAGQDAMQYLNRSDSIVLRPNVSQAQLDAAPAMSAKGITDTSPSAKLDAKALKKIIPEIDGKTAKDAAPVLARALEAAKITDPEEASAYIAMVAQQTKGFTSGDAYQVAVDDAQKWKDDPSLGKLAKAGKLNDLAKTLGIDVSAVDKTSDPAQPQSDQDWMRWGAKQIGVKPEVLASVMALESGFDPKIWGGDGGQYFGLIQFGKGARDEVNLDPNRDNTFATQMPKVVAYFKSRGFDASKYGGDERQTQMHLYATVLGGNPDATTSMDSNGTSAAGVVDSMTHGDLRARAMKFLGGNTNAWGGNQVGQQYYDRAMAIFAPPTDTSSSASTGSGSGAGSTSDVGGGGGGGGSTTRTDDTGGADQADPVKDPPPQDPESQVPSSPQLQNLTQLLESMGFNEFGQPMIWALLQMFNESYQSIAGALQSNPEFQKFVKEHGGKATKGVVAAFLGTKMKATGITASPKGVLSGKNGPINGWQDLFKQLGLETKANPTTDPGTTLPDEPVPPVADGSPPDDTIPTPDESGAPDDTLPTPGVPTLDPVSTPSPTPIAATEEAPPLPNRPRSSRRRAGSRAGAPAHQPHAQGHPLDSRLRASQL